MQCSKVYIYCQVVDALKDSHNLMDAIFPNSGGRFALDSVSSRTLLEWEKGSTGEDGEKENDVLAVSGVWKGEYTEEE